MRLVAFAATLAAAALLTATPAQAQRCDIPREARDIWRCENGFVVGAENVIIRLPIPETDPEALYNAGLEAARREDWRVAIAYFTAAYQRAHLVPRYIYNLGLAHARAGHDLPAMAWLSAFLIAQPDAPNRREVWNEMARLEARSQNTIEALWQSARQAADTLPSVRRSNENPRWMAYGALASAAIMRGDLAGAQDILRTRAGFCNSDDPVYCPPVVPGALPLSFQLWARTAVLRHDFDIEAADAIIIRAHLEGLDNSEDELLIEWARADRLTALSYWTFEPGFTRRGFDWFAVTGWSPLELARAGEREELARRLAGPRLSGSFAAYELAVSAARGDVNAVVAILQRGGISEFQASDAGELLLLGGDVEAAERVLMEMQRMPNPHPSAWNGLGVMRLRALLAAERGEIDTTLTELEIASSRFVVAAPYDVGQYYWWRISRAPPAMLAEHLVNRERGQDAFTLLSRMDSFRRVRLLESLALRHDLSAAGLELGEVQERLGLALRDASQNCSTCIARRIGIENAAINAMNLPEVAYSLRAYMDFVSELQDAAQQTSALTQTVTDLAAAQRRIRAIYRRSGGTWAQ